MSSVKQQLKDIGLSCTLTLRETGQVLSLNFSRGQDTKNVHITIGHHNLEGTLKLVDTSGGEGKPNLKLLLLLAEEKPTNVFQSAPLKATSAEKPAPVEESEKPSAPAMAQAETTPRSEETEVPPETPKTEEKVPTPTETPQSEELAMAPPETTKPEESAKPAPAPEKAPAKEKSSGRRHRR